ncbi:MAG: hypothetical protein JO281_14860 [Pseudonocardiales bacterium]|nr:hypothetical protein [Pseudonocardiales bacterium]
MLFGTWVRLMVACPSSWADWPLRPARRAGVMVINGGVAHRVAPTVAGFPGS